MTISANDRRKVYKGNGGATAFNGPRAFSDEDLEVYVGVDPTYSLMSPSTYEVMGVGTPSTVVTFNEAPAELADIVILREVEYDQDTDITNQGKFLPEIHENAFDKRVMQIQQLADDALLRDFGSGRFSYDAKGIPIANVHAVQGSDAISMDQVVEWFGPNTSSLFLQSGIGAIFRSFLMKVREVVSVRDFGALGDGITDDTANIQKAIDSGAAKLLFPAGVYIHTGLIARSGQQWIGEGNTRSIISFPQVNIPNPLGRRGVRSVADIADFGITDLGIRGNLLVQTTPEGTGQSLFGVHLRGGSVERVRFERVRIYEWGAQDKGTGGGAAIGATTGSGRLLHDVTFQSCLVENNANVPGVYVGGISTYTGSMRDIKVFDCTFRNVTNYADQNAVYILGDSALTAYSVKVDRNTFLIEQDIDTCIEINYTSGWSTSGNMITGFNSAQLIGILIRGNCYDGMIDGNTLRHAGTSPPLAAGIAIVNFNDGEVQNKISITGNTVSDFADCAINVSRWSQYLSINGNTFVSKRTRSGSIMKVASTHFSTISNNTISGGFNALLIGGGTNGIRKLDITGNNITDCGYGGGWVIESPTASEDVQGLKIVGNSFGDQVAGISGLINTPYAVPTGNVVSRNYFVSGPYINPSFIARLERWDRPATNNGVALNGQRYSFPQGSIDFASVQPGSSGSPAMFTIGANLDGSNPDVAFGDTVMVSASMDLTGVAVFGYVQSANKIRITVANVSTNASLSLAAGTWYVLVVKRT